MPGEPRRSRRGGSGIPLNAFLLAVSGVLLAAWLAVAAVASVAQQRTIRGTPKADILVGTAGNDKIYGFAGNDWIRGLGGDDIIVGGPGRDILSGGPGNDLILARDGQRDRVYCGAGRDRAVVDALDWVHKDCEIVERPSTDDPPLPPPSGVSVVQERSWTCTGRVNLDLLKVTMRPGATGNDAVHLRKDCHGVIRRIEIETWIGDGVKINAPAPAAHDLIIGGGYIRCFDRLPEAHQDGVQALGGERITFRDVEIRCRSNPHAQFFVSAASGGMPTDIVCDRCLLGAGAGSTIAIGESIRSGVRNSIVCRGRFRPINLTANAVDPVLTGNTVVLADDRRCG